MLLVSICFWSSFSTGTYMLHALKCSWCLISLLLMCSWSLCAPGVLCSCLLHTLSGCVLLRSYSSGACLLKAIICSWWLRAPGACMLLTPIYFWRLCVVCVCFTSCCRSCAPQTGTEEEESSLSAEFLKLSVLCSCRWTVVSYGGNEGFKDIIVYCKKNCWIGSHRLC